jgi:hypothetical protein
MNDVHTDTETNVSQLVGGIVADAQDLFRQQFELLRNEVRVDLRRTKTVELALSSGTVLAVVAVLLLGLALVYLLAALAPQLPLWACFGIVSVVVALISGPLLFLGMSQFKKPLSGEFVQGLEETIQWKTNPK